MSQGDCKFVLKIWHGGTFFNDQVCLSYSGKSFRTVSVDVDEMCWFTLVEEAEKGGGFRKDVDAIFYRDPVDSLKRVIDDTGAGVICREGVLKRVIDCFVVAEEDVEKVTRLIELSKFDIYGSQPKKLTPKRRKGPPQIPTLCETLKESHINNLTKSTSETPKDSSLKHQTKSNSKTPLKTPKSTPKPSAISSKNVSCNPPSPSFNSNDIRISDLCDSHEEEYLDFIDEEGSDVDAENTLGEDLFEVEIDYDDNSDDEEVRVAKETVKAWNAKALKIAKQLQTEAESGLLPCQNSENSSAPNVAREGHESDYDVSGDEEDTPSESDEEPIPGKRRKSKLPIVDEQTDFTKLRWCVGIRFPNRETIRDCVIRYAVAQGRNLKVVVSDKGRGKRLRVGCLPGCPFQLYGSWDTRRNCFVVKSVDPEHNCQRNMEKNRQLKSTWLAKQFLDVFKARPHWPASEIIETVRRAYKIIIKRGYAYKVKYHAHRMLHGSMKDHYGKVGSYIAALQHANPNGSFTLYKNPTATGPVFQRLFVCFESVKQGWLNGCRPILCVDSCFLKTFLGGQLISAVGRDANEQMYPLAWAVVEGENNDSYEWFFVQLKNSLGEKDGDGWTLISDQHPSIITMVAKEFPKAEHRHCARHIFANWHKSYRGDEFKMLFWTCAKAYNQADFDEALEAMRTVDSKAADAFIACKLHLFCRAFVKTTTKNDVIVNNMAETFNAYIINARAKHLLYMLEDIRVLLMKRLITKKTEMEKKTGVLCPNIQAKLNTEKEAAALCFVTPSSATVLEVNDGTDTLTVDLQGRTCTCRKWDLTGIPCRHGLAAIFEIHAQPEDYVFELYKRETYLTTYSASIPPCPGERHWPKVVLPLNPPPIKIGPGRPRKNRRKDPFEDPKKSGKLTRHGVEMSCSICKSKCHNKRKCPQKDNVTQPPPKRGRGRPRLHGGASSSRATTPQLQTSEAHHDVTAQPTRVGRGGRVINSGRGGRGSAGRGRIKAPVGVGVLVDDNGNVFTNNLGSASGPQSLVSVNDSDTTSLISTQASVNQDI